MSCCQTATCLPPSDAQTRRGQFAPGSTGDGHDDPIIVAVESTAETEGGGDSGLRTQERVVLTRYFSLRSGHSGGSDHHLQMMRYGDRCEARIVWIWAHLQFKLSDAYSSLLEG